MKRFVLKLPRRSHLAATNCWLWLVLALGFGLDAYSHLDAGLFIRFMLCGVAASICGYKWWRAYWLTDLLLSIEDGEDRERPEPLDDDKAA